WIRDFGVTISALSPGLFKCRFPDGKPGRCNMGWMDRGRFEEWEAAGVAVADHLRVLMPQAIKFAYAVGAPLISAFGFSGGGRPAGEPPAGVVETLARAAETVREAGLTLAIETEEGFWPDTGVRSAALVERIGDPGLGINWDPANALIEGERPFPD